MVRVVPVSIAPYLWKRRLDLLWYYGWDCASGCVWDLSAIASLSRDPDWANRHGLVASLDA